MRLALKSQVSCGAQGPAEISTLLVCLLPNSSSPWILCKEVR